MRNFDLKIRLMMDSLITFLIKSHYNPFILLFLYYLIINLLFIIYLYLNP